MNTDASRIEDLRRRIHKDPASIAFAQLAEEYRRSGQWTEAIAVSRDGLAVHPGYVSARVTLARALLQTGKLDEARDEFTTVLETAPQNLAALRGLAEIHRRQGAVQETLRFLKAARTLAPNDPEIDGRYQEALQALEERAAAPVQARAERLLGVLNGWLDAIHVTRAQRHA